MNPAHREAWQHPPGIGQSSSQRPNHQGHPSQLSPHSTPAGLPQPTGHFVPYQQSGHNLPHISGLSSPRHQPQQPSQQTGPHGPGLPQQGMGLEREHHEAKDREAREVHIKEEQDNALRRERDARERQHMEQIPPHQTQAAPIHLHQPIAVGPRTVHGPNGLLGNPTAIAAPVAHYSQMGAPIGPANVFAGGPVQPPAPSAQPGQPVNTGFLVPIATGPQAAAAAAASVGQGQQPILNDALSYLDQVKVQFVEQPDVYNRFLDIMKDFKSGAIDTPGVIERVSTLFTGNPDLIQGFNTFLPPGYRIDCGMGDDPNAIRVTTPMGSTVVAMPGPQRALSRGAHDGGGSDGQRAGNGAYTPQPSQGIQSPSGRPVGPATVSMQLSQAQREAKEREQQALVHQQEQRGVSALGNAVSAATNGSLPRQPLMSPSGGRATPQPGQEGGGPDGQAGMEKRGPVEFNHAISYVNKIKNRFASQPDIYKQFLEILQTYQRESKPIQDVYGQVTRLFHQAPDLLEDFKQFLPESAAHAKAAAQARQQAEEAAMLSNVRGEPFHSGQAPQAQQTPRAEHRLPPVGNFAPTPTTNKDHKRKRGDRQGTAMSGMGTIIPETGTSAKAAPFGQSVNANKRTKHQQSQRLPNGTDAPPLSPTLVPALPEPLPPTTSSVATSEELGFFDRAKKTIGNKNTMNEFLKLCNLFSQDLIDRATLVHRARSFIGGNPELFKWFQTWVGYEDQDALINNKPRAPTSRIMLSNCRGLGPSYRLLPKRERLKPCSGRDELCNEVLNDNWASHPTWASEDSGFIAHRKNTFEEGLHKIEEERHDYDFNIEACGRTIQLLEPYAQQLLRMPEKDRESVELPPGIGGQSETIHKRVIKKLYGRERGQQVIDQLQVRPHAVIPVLLNRLKQRHEEWKSAQREWEKVWRDQTQKMFWKSLDHQASNAKQNDKRQFQTKTLIGEIQTKYEEQKRQRILGASASQISKPQMLYNFQDPDVFVDATFLVLTFVEQTQSTEYPRLASFIKEFVPMFFGLDTEFFNTQLQRLMGGSISGDGGDDTVSAFEDPLGSRGRKLNGRKDDLRRGVLTKSGRRDDGSATPLSRASTPDNASRVDEEMADDHASATNDDSSDTPGDTWAEYPPGANSFFNRDVELNQPYRRQVYNLYGNGAIYCFLRMFAIFYERLKNLKNAEAAVKETVRRAMVPKAAIELGLVDRLPNEFFTDVSDNANYYRQVLSMFEDLIKNDMDMSHIEETLRRYYLQHGWQLYSIDKLISSLVRFAVGVMGSDSRDRTFDILQLFKKDRAKEETAFQDEINYRKNVEKLVKDGDIYRISYNNDERQMAIKVFKKDEPTFDTSRLIAEDKWRVYVNDYLSMAPTTGTSIDKVSVPILKKNIKILSKDGTVAGIYGGASPAVEPTDKVGRRFDLVRAKEALEFKIGVGDFKLHFQINSDEYWHQPAGARAGGKDVFDEAEETTRHREEGLQDGSVMNNDAMKGLSKEDVEGKNGDFVRLVGEGSGGSARDVEDEEMADE